MSDQISKRIGTSNAMKVLVIVLAAMCVIPLFLILGYIVASGASVISLSFITHAERPAGEPGGGVLHAIVGSGIVLSIACAIAVPVGILCGVFLSEYKNSRLAYWARVSVDVLQGVPSIVIGVIAYVWLVKPFGYSAFSGGLALAVMMLPVVSRSTEETLLLLPSTLREAGLALGMPFHKVIFKVILPCGIGGILSGIMLALARVAGETAPLLFTAFGCMFLSADLRTPVETLPHLVFKYAISPDTNWKQLAWGASLILLIFVFVINISTRLITRKWKVQL
jgi:phosphate transport system permease protein